MQHNGRDSAGRSVVASTLVILTCLVLVLLAGGMLVIGVSFVSFWKSLSPSDFQAWFASHSHLVGRLMIPLGVGSIAVTVAAVVACWRGSAPSRRWLLIAAVSVMGVMVTYPLFFGGHQRGVRSWRSVRGSGAVLARSLGDLALGSYRAWGPGFRRRITSTSRLNGHASPATLTSVAMAR